MMYISYSTCSCRFKFKILWHAVRRHHLDVTCYSYTASMEHYASHQLAGSVADSDIQGTVCVLLTVVWKWWAIGSWENYVQRIYVIYSESLLYCKFVMVGNTVVIRNTYCSQICTWQPKYHIRNQMYIFTDTPLWLLIVLKPIMELWVVLQSWNFSWNMWDKLEFNMLRKNNYVNLTTAEIPSWYIANMNGCVDHSCRHICVLCNKSGGHKDA